MVQAKGMKKKVIRKRRKMTAAEKETARVKREEVKYKKSVKEIFTSSGFKYARSEDRHFTFTIEGAKRTGEFDGIYLFENILVVAEDTCAKNKVNEHLAKKLIIFRLASENPQHFVKCLCENVPDFKAHFDANCYDAKDYKLVVCYFSMYPVGKEHVENAERQSIFVVQRPLVSYFKALVDTVGASAKYELFKYFRLKYEDIGAIKVSGGNKREKSEYSGFLLPDSNSSYPQGYQVVSFYADPFSLLQKSFVLRKNGWEAPNLSYQRLLDSKKIKAMRKYLSGSKRVYVNNIIATLPSSARILDHDSGSELKVEDKASVKAVKVLLPNEYNVVGLIDGQHRVFSYHEGNDAQDAEIRKLRVKQNLLVTGIIHPAGLDEAERASFEAKLFLEINDRQTRVKSALTQEIELLVNPYSITATARAVIAKLSKTGPLEGKLEEHVFDNVKKLKISSIVSYGLKPLIKKEGDDSLYSAWDDAEAKSDMALIARSDSGRNKRRIAHEKYVDFCVQEINVFLRAIRRSLRGAWEVEHEEKCLTPTSLNGYLKCFRLVISSSIERTEESYDRILENIATVDIKLYKSSQWNALGTALFSTFSPARASD